MNNSLDLYGSPSIKGQSTAGFTTGQTQQLTQQQQFNLAAAFVAAQQQHQQERQQQQQQQTQQQQLIHNALTRAVSNPVSANGVVSNLFSSINEIINVGAANSNGGHRKLERTQSEPLPQVNTSR